MSKELEARLLASVPSIGHFQHLEELGIVEDSFKHYGPMYRYIGEIVKQHNHLPRLLDLRATFNVPTHVQRKTEEYEWLLNEFLQLTTVQRIQDVMDSTVEKYGEDPKELLPALIKDLTRLQLPDQRTASLTDQTALKRLARYTGMSDEIGGFLVGVPTGLRYFDADYRIGWLPGELVGIIGRLYIGKTWMLIYFGTLAWMFGKRVLFISPEMPQEEAEARFDTLICGLHNVPVDVTELYRGFKPTKAQQDLLSSVANRANWITVTSDEGRPFRLGELPRLVRQYNPDVLLIDGLLLVGPDSRGQAWEQVKDLSYGLKNLAVGAGIVILVTHQANRQAYNTAKPPGLHEIYMGDAFAQACDRVLVLSKPSKEDDTLRITIQKFRKGKPLHVGTDFEFSPGVGKVKEKIGDLGTTNGLGDLGADVQEGAGNEDLLPIP